MKHCLITGANRGIGLALAEQLSANYHVIAVCRNSSDILNGLNVEVIENIDVTNENVVTKLVATLPHLDLVIQNAGIWDNETIDTINFQSIEKQVQVNALAPLFFISQLHQQHKLNSQSKIALITSRMGSIADNDSGGRYGYRMSKAALNAGGKSLALDLKPEYISVALIHPGWVQTDMGGQHAPITTEQSAQGIIKVINTLSIENTGQFWHQNGDILPW